MGILDDLNRLDAAEDFFRYLDVPFKPEVLRVARLHVMRRFGEYIRRPSPCGLNEEEVRQRYQGLLKAAHYDFVDRPALNARVFKVLRDAVDPPHHGLIPASALRHR